ncbi:hypothetical protein HDV00_003875 [Rhizophlyctis rosea]|nr:hypothetical protein HDV00_003875 [Rhizophlyctis rosea]
MNGGPTTKAPRGRGRDSFSTDDQPAEQSISFLMILWSFLLAVTAVICWLPFNVFIFFTSLYLSFWIGVAKRIYRVVKWLFSDTVRALEAWTYKKADDMYKWLCVNSTAMYYWVFGGLVGTIWGIGLAVAIVCDIACPALFWSVTSFFRVIRWMCVTSRFYSLVQTIFGVYRWCFNILLQFASYCINQKLFGNKKPIVSRQSEADRTPFQTLRGNLYEWYFSLEAAKTPNPPASPPSPPPSQPPPSINQPAPVKSKSARRRRRVPSPDEDNLDPITIQTFSRTPWKGETWTYEQISSNPEQWMYMEVNCARRIGLSCRLRAASLEDPTIDCQSPPPSPKEDLRRRSSSDTLDSGYRSGDATPDSQLGPDVDEHGRGQVKEH